MAANTIYGERERRLALWSELQQRGGPDGVAPGLIKELQIHRGQQGVFRDQTTTAPLTPDGHGIAVGLLHTGSSYADDLFEDGLIYHYPATKRGQRDRNEIAALKACGEMRLPIFVVLTPPDRKTRNVRLGWIIDTDDLAGQLLIAFAETAPPSSRLTSYEEDTAFSLKTTRSPTAGTIKRRRRRAQFRFAVFKRYGSACTFCAITDPRLLEAAHLCPVEEDGTDDPRNGLVMCPTHHKAFDSGLLLVHPDSLAIRIRGGASLDSVGVKVTSIGHLKRQPHRDALAWVWSRRGMGEEIGLNE